MITRGEFLRICERAERTAEGYLRAVDRKFAEVAAALGPWPACREAMECAARREYARVTAAQDQYDTALHDVPLSWLTPHQLWQRG